MNPIRNMGFAKKYIIMKNLISSGVRKYVAGIFVVASLSVLPAVSEAYTIAQLQAMIAKLQAQLSAMQNNQSTTGWCHTFNTDIEFRDNTGEVSALQSALEKDGIDMPSFPNAEAKKYFNAATSMNVKAFQKKYGISQSGYVGPKTRAKLNAIYGCVDNHGKPIINPANIKIITPSEGTIQSIESTIRWESNNFVGNRGTVNLVLLDVNDSFVANIGGNIPNLGSYKWKIPASLSGQYKIQVGSNKNSTGGMYAVGRSGLFTISNHTSNGITINSVSGPNSLNVGQTGTWKINATAPSGMNLTYFVDWGDIIYPVTAGGVAPTYRNAVQTLTFTHSYAQAGTYTVKFRVECDGTTAPNPTCRTINTPTSSLTVVVGNTSVPSITVLSPNGGETLRQGQTYTIKWSTNNISSDKKIGISLQVHKPETGELTTSDVIDIARNINNTGSYNWTVPSNIVARQYVIEVYTVEWVDGRGSDTSNYFSIVAP